jgi:hypothetical protein
LILICIYDLAFSTNLSIQTAREACASCYGGSLANVGAADLNFLGNNLESTSWIKAWNGDDYSSGCLTIHPSAGARKYPFFSLYYFNPSFLG